MIDTTIYIDNILKPTIFANQLIEFLFDKNNITIIEITIFQKLKPEDKKALKGIYDNSFINRIISNNYNFTLDLDKYRSIKNRLEKYFKGGWAFTIISGKHQGVFSSNMDICFIDCVDENDKAEKEQFLDSLILSKVINEYEVDENDWIDPYYEK